MSRFPLSPVKERGLDPRVRTAIAVYLFTALGIFLTVVPWSPIWTQALGGAPAALAKFAAQGWVRGVVSGVGLLDLIVALQKLGSLWSRLDRPAPVERPRTTPNRFTD